MKSMAGVFLLMPMFLVSTGVMANDGEELFVEYCQSCHETDAAILNDFQGSRQRFSEILEGDTQEMPDFFGFFDDAEVDALYQYISNQ